MARRKIIKVIWKDFPLFLLSFNQAIISFVIKYHLSSCSFVLQPRGRGRLVKCTYVYIYMFGMPHVAQLVNSLCLSMVKRIFVALLSHFIFFCASISLCSVLCIHFQYGVHFVTCIDSNGSVCVEYSTMIRLRSSMVMSKMQWVTKKKRKRSLYHTHTFVQIYIHTETICKCMYKMYASEKLLLFSFKVKEKKWTKIKATLRDYYITKHLM